MVLSGPFITQIISHPFPYPLLSLVFLYTYPPHRYYLHSHLVKIVGKRGFPLVEILVDKERGDFN